MSNCSINIFYILNRYYNNINKIKKFIYIKIASKKIFHIIEKKLKEKDNNIDKNNKYYKKVGNNTNNKNNKD